MPTATRGSSSCCSRASTTISPATTSRPSASGRAWCSSSASTTGSRVHRARAQRAGRAPARVARSCVHNGVDAYNAGDVDDGARPADARRWSRAAERHARSSSSIARTRRAARPWSTRRVRTPRAHRSCDTARAVAGTTCVGGGCRRSSSSAGGGSGGADRRRLRSSRGSPTLRSRRRLRRERAGVEPLPRRALVRDRPGARADALCWRAPARRPARRSSVSTSPIRCGPRPTACAPTCSARCWPRRSGTRPSRGPVRADEVPEVRLSGIRNRRPLQELRLRLLAAWRTPRRAASPELTGRCSPERLPLVPRRPARMTTSRPASAVPEPAPRAPSIGAAKTPDTPRLSRRGPSRLFAGGDGADPPVRATRRHSTLSTSG